MAKNASEDTKKWLVQSLRATFFTTEKISEEEIDNFLKSAGDFEIVRKEENPKIAKQNIIAVSGETKLNIQILPIRIDLNISPKDEISASPLSIETLGGQDDTLSDFVSFAEKFVTTTEKKVTRVALGYILLKPAQNHEEGYSTVSKYLPFPLDGKNSSDFQFQINIPTTSSIVKDLKVNRLSKWSVLKFNLSLQSTIEIKSTDLASEVYYSRLELDINTDQFNTKFFSVTKIKDLLSELNNLAIALSDKGVH